MQWLELAKQLPVGHHDRYKCCGSDAAANIYHSEEGYSLHCFRNSDHNEFIGHGYRNYKELLEIKERNKEALVALQTAKVKLPFDFTHDIPPEGMLWLLKASITPYMAKQAGFGWTPYFKRVMLPVYNKDELVYYQARAVLHGQTPKYLNPKVDRSSILYWKRHSVSSGIRRVVVTEDILSAERIFLANDKIDTVSLLGTKITIQQANQIARYTNVTTWLDGDEAGIHGAQAVHNKVGLATRVTNIVTPKDPKLLSNKQIREQL